MKTRISDLPYAGTLDDDDAIIVFRGDENERTAARSYIRDIPGGGGGEGKVDRDGDTMTGELNVTITSSGTSTLGGNSLEFDSPGHVKNLTAYPEIDEAASRRFVDGVTSGYYTGADLSSAFAQEIAAKGNVWTWIKWRITKGNYAGIRIGDYIPFTVGGYTYHAEVAGINTYKGYGNNANIVGNHIDFISREVYRTAYAFNTVNFNNGTKFGTDTATEFPWLASNLYLYMNSLTGTRATEAAAGGGSGQSVDYTEGGIYSLLPDALKAVISEKTMYAEKRFNASSLANNSAAAGWASLGKLWLPTEAEVFGRAVFGGASFASCGSVAQYPIFANGQAVKYRAGTTTRCSWWMLNAYEGGSTNFCRVTSTGQTYHVAASDSATYVPICFRVMADAPLLAMGAPTSDGEGGDEV